VYGKDRIMPVLEQVDQQTQMMEQLMQEVQMLRESNANMKGTLDEYNKQMIANVQNAGAPMPGGGQMSVQALGVGGNQAALIGGPRK
jgi:hypothetical protein